MYILLVLLMIPFAVDAGLLLAGETVSTFKDRFVGVEVVRNPYTDKFTNRSLPALFENTMVYDKRYEHLVILENDTDISFYVTVDNYNGFGFSVKTDRGDEIVENLYVYSCNVCADSGGYAYQYQKSSKIINAISAENPEIPTRVAAKIKHVIVTVWRLDYYENYYSGNTTIKHTTIGTKGNNGEVYVAESTHPVKRDISAADQPLSGNIMNNEESEANFEMGMARPLEDSRRKYRATAYVGEDRGDILGRIEMDLFVLNCKFEYRSYEKVRGLYTSEE